MINPLLLPAAKGEMQLSVSPAACGSLSRGCRPQNRCAAMPRVTRTARGAERPCQEHDGFSAWKGFLGRSQLFPVLSELHIHELWSRSRHLFPWLFGAHSCIFWLPLFISAQMLLCSALPLSVCKLVQGVQCTDCSRSWAV